MCDHSHHIGLGKKADSRWAEGTWMAGPDGKVELEEIFRGALSLLHEYDELRLPPRDPIELAKLRDVQTRVANWLCGEGEWKPGG